ncbi:MAG: hypothetical protein D6675_10825 [Gemmatimonadetes bacterium]|nr:MAG: hypothetical protein D6675_10825 [Gemmatimonadota bacterium]
MKSIWKDIIRFNMDKTPGIEGLYEPKPSTGVKIYAGSGEAWAGIPADNSDDVRLDISNEDYLIIHTEEVGLRSIHHVDWQRIVDIVFLIKTEIVKTQIVEETPEEIIIDWHHQKLRLPREFINIKSRQEDKVVLTLPEWVYQQIFK